MNSIIHMRYKGDLTFSLNPPLQRQFIQLQKIARSSESLALQRLYREWRY